MLAQVETCSDPDEFKKLILKETEQESARRAKASGDALNKGQKDYW
jgi:hypothetical protein